MIDLRRGDALDVLRTLPDASVDAVICDPPAGIRMLGKEWDSDRGGRREWIAWLAAILAEALRVAKPGAHALIWALPRTSHWTGTAIEDAGWEPRDTICHLFGSGFPKSLDVGKAIDRMAGAEREVIGVAADFARDGHARRTDGSHARPTLQVAGGDRWSQPVTAPATDEAKRWDGFGTALKPSHEIWWLARAPLAESTIAGQVLATGTGALNIDACRIGWPNSALPAIGTPGWDGPHKKVSAVPDDGGRANEDRMPPNAGGRWPANVAITCCGQEPHGDGCPVRILDEQAGERTSGAMKAGTKRANLMGYTGAMPAETLRDTYGDSGSVSRFFYVAKPSTRERQAGMPDGLRNDHPTVKPVELMRWLVRLACPPGGVVLDPFCGSGTTGVACVREGMGFIGIDLDPHHIEIASARIAHAAPDGDLPLFAAQGRGA